VASRLSCYHFEELATVNKTEVVVHVV
jgi:hypothetical protein